jgi:hypothetical protein
MSKNQDAYELCQDLYCEKRKELKSIRNKMCGMLTSGVFNVLDNEHPHTAVRIAALLEHFNWVLFDLPHYSCDLAPSDYHLFTYLYKAED